MSDRIKNTIVILLAILVFTGIAFIIKKDSDKIQQHLTDCRQKCYPRKLVEELSRNYCICQTEPTENIELDKE